MKFPSKAINIIANKPIGMEIIILIFNLIFSNRLYNLLINPQTINRTKKLTIIATKSTIVKGLLINLSKGMLITKSAENRMN